MSVYLYECVFAYFHVFSNRIGRWGKTPWAGIHLIVFVWNSYYELVFVYLHECVFVYLHECVFAYFHVFLKSRGRWGKTWRAGVHLIVFVWNSYYEYLCICMKMHLCICVNVYLRISTYFWGRWGSTWRAGVHLPRGSCCPLIHCPPFNCAQVGGG